MTTTTNNRLRPFPERGTPEYDELCKKCNETIKSCVTNYRKNKGPIMWNRERIEKIDVVLKEIQIILCEIKYDLLLLRYKEENTTNRKIENEHCNN